MNHSKHQSVWAHWGPAVSLWTQLTNQAGTNRPSEACYAYVSADQSLDKCNRCRKAMQKSKSSELHIRWQSGSYVLRRHFKIVSFCAARVKSMQVNHCCFWSSIVSFLLAGWFWILCKRWRSCVYFAQRYLPIFCVPEYGKWCDCTCTVCPLGCRLRRLPLWLLKSRNFSFLFQCAHNGLMWHRVHMHSVLNVCFNDPETATARNHMFLVWSAFQ